MPFADIRGQDRAAEFLRRAMRADRVAHAYLFRGPDGIGKFRVAGEFAAALICPQATHDACGQCRDCRRIAHGNHPDVDVIEHPEGKRYIRIDQVRRLLQSAQRAPVEADWKVYIIRDAERMVLDAQNTMLKTLEEPPPRRVIILVSCRPDRLVSTILSRCHQLRFQPLEPGVMCRLLAGQGEWPEEEIAFAAACSGGSMGRALRLLRVNAASTRDNSLPKLDGLRLGGAMELAEALNEAVSASDKELEGKREGVRLFLELVTAFYRDAAVLAEGAEDEQLYHPDRCDLARRVAERLGADAVLRIVEVLWQARDSVERNANIRLTIENALFAIAEVEAKAG